MRHAEDTPVPLRDSEQTAQDEGMDEGEATALADKPRAKEIYLRLEMIAMTAKLSIRPKSLAQ